ncbi:MAG: SIS domain-containing protein [Actinobacteria bacterium]|nr:SIS domain-containing protein [Actinomycetota bacterium]
MTVPFTTDPQARLQERERVLGTFLDDHAEKLGRASHAMARAFGRGGTLIAGGTGSAATDAAHVAVEFLHPVIVGKRALPALAPSNDPTGSTQRAGAIRAGDIAMSITHGPLDDAGSAFLAAAARQGGLTIALTGTGGPPPPADHLFTVPSRDPHLIQEVQEFAYHVLWELVHTFFEHPGLIEDACITCGDIALPGRVVAVEGATATVDFDGLREEVAAELVEGVAVGDLLLCHAGVALERLEPEAAPEDPTAFLYPFLQRSERDVDVVLRDALASTLQKGEEVLRLQHGLDIPAIDGCARAIRKRLVTGGRVLTLGNGGSCTDAQDLASDLLDRGWPATALVNDVSTVTALANDVGFENVFSRQVVAFGRNRDVVIAFSTSGSSQNVVSALAAAHRLGMLTCAIVGHDGGLIGTLPWIDQLLHVHSEYVPRVQEAQATMYHLILEAIGTPT